MDPEAVDITLSVFLGRSKYYVKYKAAQLLYELTEGRQLTRKEQNRLYARVLDPGHAAMKRTPLELLIRVTEKPLPGGPPGPKKNLI